MFTVLTIGDAPPPQVIVYERVDVAIITSLYVTGVELLATPESGAFVVLLHPVNVGELVPIHVPPPIF